jgi:hypothetical protein
MRFVHGGLKKAGTAVKKFYRYAANESLRMAPKRLSYDINMFLIESLFNRFAEDYGVPIWDRDWDVLIILDACRTDEMNEVANDYEFLEKYTSHNSIGSNSGQWMRRNFNDTYREEMQKTALVTGNAKTFAINNQDDFEILDEVWRYAWENNDEMFEPKYITDRAISISRQKDPEKLIVHYMQPHLPFLPYFDGTFRTKLHSEGINQWRDARVGLRDWDTMWSQYIDNLEYVLEYVELLLNSIDAETVVISADHGEAVGEWGIYGHPDIPMRVLREVPWVVTSAEDTGEYEPESTHGGSAQKETHISREDQLKALGYRGE